MAQSHKFMVPALMATAAETEEPRVNPNYKALCERVCNLTHTCVMTEHPEREPCNRENCQTVRIVNDICRRLVMPVTEVHIRTSAAAADRRPWPRDKVTEAIQTVIPYIVDNPGGPEW